MKNPFLIGERIYLRGVEKSDLSGEYFQWLNDYEVTRFLESGVFPNSQEAMEAYYQARVTSSNEVFLAIVLKENDRHIGNLKLGPVNWIHRFAELGILVGAKDCWNKGYGTEATVLLMDYAFKRLNLNKVTLGVIAENEAAVRVYERIGFVKEGRITEYYLIDGRYRDKIVMGLTAKQFYEKNQDLKK